MPLSCCRGQIRCSWPEQESSGILWPPVLLVCSCGNPEGPLSGQQGNFAWTFKSLWRYFYTKACPARALQGLAGGLWHQDYLRSQEMLDARR